MSTIADIIRGNVTTERLEFVLEECINCGIPFMLTKRMQKRLIATHELFYCPGGHAQHYSGPSETEKLKKELQTEKERALREQEILQNKFLDEMNRANKLQRKLKRVDKGVCPCCNRTFSNLARHMKIKHSEEKLKT